MPIFYNYIVKKLGSYLNRYGFSFSILIELYGSRRNQVEKVNPFSLKKVKINESEGNNKYFSCLEIKLRKDIFKVIWKILSISSKAIRNDRRANSSTILQKLHEISDKR